MLQQWRDGLLKWTWPEWGPRALVVTSVALPAYVATVVALTVLDLSAFAEYARRAFIGVTLILAGTVGLPDSRLWARAERIHRWLLARRHSRALAALPRWTAVVGATLLVAGVLIEGRWGAGLVVVALLLLVASILPIWIIVQGPPATDRFGFGVMLPHYAAYGLTVLGVLVGFGVLVPMAFTGALPWPAVTVSFLLAVPIVASLRFSTSLLRRVDVGKERYLDGTVSLRVNVVCALLVITFLSLLELGSLDAANFGEAAPGLLTALLVAQPYIVTFGKGISEYTNARKVAGALPPETCRASSNNVASSH